MNRHRNARTNARRRKSQSSPSRNKPRSCSGVLETHPKGFGFLRQPDKGLARREDDVFVPESIIRDLSMQQGVFVEGECQVNNKKTGARLSTVNRLESVEPKHYKDLIPFEDRTPTNPTNWLNLEYDSCPVSMRVLDLLTPIGLGQRALIASPPRAGKTTLLKQIAASISNNYPDVQMAALLIDERPEEVTEIREELKGEVYASCLDRSVLDHARLSQLAIDRCKRMAESGKNVFLLVDSLTRMARAFNKLPNLSGPIGAGGFNIRAFDIPKQVFAAARTFKEGGSLTIVATVLIETENRMDEVIFQEFKGTGNLDLVLSQNIADHRIWPAIDLAKSATRRSELMHDANTYDAVSALRRTLLTMPTLEAIRELTTKLGKFPNNGEFLSLIQGRL